MPSLKDIASMYHEDLEHFEPYVAQLAVHREYFRKELQSVIPGLTGDRSWYSRKTKTDSRRSLSRAEPRGGNDKKLLDIGCAMGVLLEEAKKIGYKVQGIDISQDAVTYCRKRKLDVIAGTIASARAKLKKNSFDVVTAFEIIEHEQNPLGMMLRVHELLNAGGITVLTTPNHSSFWKNHGKMVGRVPASGTCYILGSDVTYISNEEGRI